MAGTDDGSIDPSLVIAGLIVIGIYWIYVPWLSASYRSENKE